MAKTIAKKTTNQPMGSIVKKVVRKVPDGTADKYDYEYDPDDEFTVTTGNGRHNPILSAAVADNEFCCGVLEFGNLQAWPGLIKGDKAGFLKAAGSFLRKAVLAETVTKDKCRTIMVTTNGTGPSVLWEEALAESKAFVCVKEFVNMNSRNKLKIWLSSN